MEPISSALRPEIPQAIAALNHAGALKAMMTGSGSAVYGLFESANKARQALKTLERVYGRCYMTYTCLEGLVV